MCDFLSAIVLREPRNKGGFAIIHSYATDSHSDLIAVHNLRDDGKLRFARVEYSPKDTKTAHLVETYALKIDEERTPEWFDDDMKKAVAEKLAAIVKVMIVPKSGMTVLGGSWIVPPDFEVSVGPMTRIIVNSGTVTRNYGTVNDNYGTVTRNSGTVNVNSGTVTRNSGTVNVNSGTVNVNYGTVNDNYGTVTRNSGTVNDNYGTVNDNYADVVQNITTCGKGVIVSGKKALK